MTEPQPGIRPGLRRGRIVVVCVAGLAALALAIRWLWQDATPPQPISIAANRVRWGADSPVVLVSVPAWRAAGESEMVVSHEQVIGSDVRSEADARARREAFVSSTDERRAALDRIGRIYGAAEGQTLDVPHLRAIVGMDKIEILPNATKGAVTT